MRSDLASQHVVPPRQTGLRHVAAATSYSMNGLRRLLQEPAFRHELVFGAVLFAALSYGGASLAAFLSQGILFLALVAVEALNTAIELIVDRLSTDWSVFAKSAKDLGSLAVGCFVVANVMLTLLSCI